MNPITFKVPARELRAIARFVSKDESRYVITGVLFELNGSICNLVATDGQRLAAMQVPLTSDEPVSGVFILEVSQILDWKLNVWYDEQGDSHDEDFDSGGILVRIFGTCVYMNCGPLLAAGTVIDGNFPNWRQLFTTYTFEPGQSETVALNTEFLHDFGIAHCEILRRHIPHIAVLPLKTTSEPMVIDIGVPKFTGLLMPVRVGGFGLEVASLKDLTSWIISP